ncbi:hypothetical protein QTP70_035021, partial [Hemibagrus guttatus]
MTPWPGLSDHAKAWKYSSCQDKDRERAKDRERTQERERNREAKNEQERERDQENTPSFQSHSSYRKPVEGTQQWGRVGELAAAFWIICRGRIAFRATESIHHVTGTTLNARERDIGNMIEKEEKEKGSIVTGGTGNDTSDTNPHTVDAGMAAAPSREMPTLSLCNGCRCVPEPGVRVEELLEVVGEQAGFDIILSASRMNKAIVVRRSSCDWNTSNSFLNTTAVSMTLPDHKLIITECDLTKETWTVWKAAHEHQTHNPRGRNGQSTSDPVEMRRPTVEVHAILCAAENVNKRCRSDLLQGFPVLTIEQRDSWEMELTVDEVTAAMVELSPPAVGEGIPAVTERATGDTDPNAPKRNKDSSDT